MAEKRKMVSELLTQKVERPGILDKISTFLPKIKASNSQVSESDRMELEINTESSSHSSDTCAADTDPGTSAKEESNENNNVIILDLGLGVFDAPGMANQLTADVPCIKDDDDNDEDDDDKNGLVNEME